MLIASFTAQKQAAPTPAAKWPLWAAALIAGALKRNSAATTTKA